MTFFDFFSSFFTSFPFFFLWLATVCLWGLLDIYNLSAHFFNSKHSYSNLLNRENIFLTLFSLYNDSNDKRSKQAERLTCANNNNEKKLE